MNIRRLWLLPSILLIVSCGGGKGLKTYDLGTPATAQVDTYVDSENPKVARGTKRVVIPYFQVEFAQQSSAKNNNGYDHHQVIVTMTGVAAARFQAITNDFYDAVVSDLKAAGVDVVPIEQMNATPEFKELSSHGFKDSPDTVEHQDNISKFYAPHGMQVYYLPADERFAGIANNKKSTGLAAGISSFAGVMTSTYGGAAYKFVPQEVALAKAIDAKVLRVRVVVDFADVEAVNDGVKGVILMSFAPKDSFYRFNGPDGEGGFFLKVPLVLGDKVAERKQIGDKHWEAATNGAAYEATVRKHLDAFRAMMTAMVKSSL
jgi:hypothetical protein